MTDLTDDEFTILMIAAQGEYLAPIGRWQEPILSAASRGLLKKLNDVNYVITDAGKQAIKERDQQDDQALRGAYLGVAKKMDTAATTQASIQEFIRQAADLLAQAARASSLVTGDAPAVSAQRWGEVIVQEALTRLR